MSRDLQGKDRMEISDSKLFLNKTKRKNRESPDYSDSEPFADPLDNIEDEVNKLFTAIEIMIYGLISNEKNPSIQDQIIESFKEKYSHLKLKLNPENLAGLINEYEIRDQFRLIIKIFSTGIFDIQENFSEFCDDLYGSDDQSKIALFEEAKAQNLINKCDDRILLLLFRRDEQSAFNAPIFKNTRSKWYS